ncbi:hypothetical protein [Sphingobacterium sp. UBA7253]|uniref:hypothetical protein n=1 Tax=Sphingobacterium sp. UBA7253 TaxID=1947517 RepID=UPI00257D3B83|nr:hypothetical protein [Sphingobacterium sp. UBA7253]
MYRLTYNLLLSVFLLLTLPGLAVKAQLRDTMINVGNHSLHFTLMEGKGIPIVFESGAGNDGSNPAQVVGTVMIDIVSPYLMTMERSKSLKSEYASELDNIKKESLGFYHLVLNYEASTAVLHEVAGKINVPMTVIGSGKSPFEEPDRSLFIAALKKFADQKNNRRYLLAQNAEHHVFYDEPDLVIDEIVKLYQKTAFE